jgi:hypothetical protein
MLAQSTNKMIVQKYGFQIDRDVADEIKLPPKCAQECQLEVAHGRVEYLDDATLHDNAIQADGKSGSVFQSHNVLDRLLLRMYLGCREYTVWDRRKYAEKMAEWLMTTKSKADMDMLFDTTKGFDSPEVKKLMSDGWDSEHMKSAMTVFDPNLKRENLRENAPEEADIGYIMEIGGTTKYDVSTGELDRNNADTRQYPSTSPVHPSNLQKFVEETKRKLILKYLADRIRKTADSTSLNTDLEKFGVVIKAVHAAENGAQLPVGAALHGGQAKRGSPEVIRAWWWDDATYQASYNDVISNNVMDKAIALVKDDVNAKDYDTAELFVMTKERSDGGKNWVRTAHPNGVVYGDKDQQSNWAYYHLHSRSSMLEFMDGIKCVNIDEFNQDYRNAAPDARKRLRWDDVCYCVIDGQTGFKKQKECGIPDCATTAAYLNLDDRCKCGTEVKERRQCTMEDVITGMQKMGKRVKEFVDIKAKIKAREYLRTPDYKLGLESFGVTVEPRVLNSNFKADEGQKYEVQIDTDQDIYSEHGLAITKRENKRFRIETYEEELEEMVWHSVDAPTRQTSRRNHGTYDYREHIIYQENAGEFQGHVDWTSLSSVTSTIEMHTATEDEAGMLRGSWIRPQMYSFAEFSTDTLSTIVGSDNLQKNFAIWELNIPKGNSQNMMIFDAAGDASECKALDIICKNYVGKAGSEFAAEKGICDKLKSNFETADKWAKMMTLNPDLHDSSHSQACLAERVANIHEQEFGARCGSSPTCQTWLDIIPSETKHTPFQEIITFGKFEDLKNLRQWVLGCYTATLESHEKKQDHPDLHVSNSWVDTFVSSLKHECVYDSAKSSIDTLVEDHKTAVVKTIDGQKVDIQGRNVGIGCKKDSLSPCLSTIEAAMDKKVDQAKLSKAILGVPSDGAVEYTWWECKAQDVTSYRLRMVGINDYNDFKNGWDAIGAKFASLKAESMLKDLKEEKWKTEKWAPSGFFLKDAKVTNEADSEETPCKIQNCAESECGSKNAVQITVASLKNLADLEMYYFNWMIGFSQDVTEKIFGPTGAKYVEVSWVALAEGRDVQIQLRQRSLHQALNWNHNHKISAQISESDWKGFPSQEVIFQWNGNKYNKGDQTINAKGEVEDVKYEHGAKWAAMRVKKFVGNMEGSASHISVMVSFLLAAMYF